MKREELKELGLSDEQVNSVMASAKKDENALRDQLTTITSERDSLQSQVDTNAAELRKLEKANKDNEKLTSQLSTLRQQVDDQKKQFEAEQTAAKIDSLLANELSAAKVRDTDVVKALINREDLSLGDDGTLKGLSDQLKPLQEQKAWLFEGKTKTKYSPEGSSNDDTKGADLAAAMKREDFNFTEWAQSQKED